MVPAILKPEISAGGFVFSRPTACWRFCAPPGRSPRSPKWSGDPCPSGGASGPLCEPPWNVLRFFPSSLMHVTASRPCQMCAQHGPIKRLKPANQQLKEHTTSDTSPLS
jgi:hypothetical protein